MRLRSQILPYLLLPALIFATADGSVADADATGLPLPRFVSLDADEVNLRTGPGFQYPVEWVYHRATLPMEIVAEYRNWRKVRDWQGAEGWVHKRMLSGRRSVITTGGVQALRAEPEARSPELALIEPGVIARLQSCPESRGYCRVRVSGLEGWLDRDAFWGAYPDEIIR